MTRFASPLLSAVLLLGAAACSPPGSDIAADPEREPAVDSAAISVSAAATNSEADTPPDNSDAGSNAAAASAAEPADPAVAAAATAAATGAPDSRAVPRQGVLKTFGDWAVGCDNGLRCTFASLLPEAGEADNVTLNIVREGDGLTKAYIDSRDEAIRPASLWVDGRRIATALTPDASRDIAEALPAGRRLELRDRKDRTVATISLKGVAAAMRYADAVQRRAGTPSALVAKGPSTRTIGVEALPVIVALPITGTAATPTRAQLATMRKQGECDLTDDGTGVLSPEAHAIGGGKTLVILPCSTGAYNLIGALFVIDGKRIVPAQVDAPSGFEETGADPQTPVRSVVNASFAGGVLGSYAKGRGIGDCGVQQSFVWDGTRLRLSEQSAMGECRGNPNYISTWRTTVVRR